MSPRSRGDGTRRGKIAARQAGGSPDALPPTGHPEDCRSLGLEIRRASEGGDDPAEREDPVMKYFVTKNLVARREAGWFLRGVPTVVDLNKALADSTRWRIVRMAMTEPLCVCELADVLEMPQSSVSSHVQIIRKAGLLESEKAEKWTYFRVRSEYLKLLRAMTDLFPDGEADCAADEQRLEDRLARRRGSCCPGPKQLKSRKPKSSTC